MHGSKKLWSKPELISRGTPEEARAFYKKRLTPEEFEAFDEWMRDSMREVGEARGSYFPHPRRRAQAIIQ